MIRFTGLSLGLFLRVMTPFYSPSFYCSSCALRYSFHSKAQSLYSCEPHHQGKKGRTRTCTNSFGDCRATNYTTDSYGGRDASHARFQPPLSVLMHRPDRLASQSLGHFALKPACWYTAVTRIELVLTESKSVALPFGYTALIFFQLVPHPLFKQKEFHP